MKLLQFFEWMMSPLISVLIWIVIFIVMANLAIQSHDRDFLIIVVLGVLPPLCLALADCIPKRMLKTNRFLRITSIITIFVGGIALIVMWLT